MCIGDHGKADDFVDMVKRQASREPWRHPNNSFSKVAQAERRPTTKNEDPERSSHDLGKLPIVLPATRTIALLSMRPTQSEIMRGKAGYDQCV